MAREKKNLHKVQMTDGKRQIIQQLIQHCLMKHRLGGHDNTSFSDPGMAGSVKPVNYEMVILSQKRGMMSRYW